MKKILQYISVLMLIVTVLSVSCCKRHEGEVIPRNELAKIYAEMFITDQWVLETPGVRQIADTSLVYAPILEKYGYTTEDYLVTIDRYMDDPDRFSRIFRTTGEILEKRLKELKKEKEIQEKNKARQREIEQLMASVRVEMEFGDFFPYLADEPYVHYYDSLTFEPDSVQMVYRLIPIERADTLYDRIRMVVRTDSLEVASDTLTEVEKVVPERQLKDPKLLMGGRSNGSK